MRSISPPDTRVSGDKRDALQGKSLPSVHGWNPAFVPENADPSIHFTLPPPPKNSQRAGGAGRAAAGATQKMNPPKLLERHRLIVCVDLVFGIYHLP